MEWRFAWKGETPPPPAAVPLPFQGRLLGGGSFGVEVGVDWKVGTPPPPSVVPLVLSGPLCPFGTSPHPVGSHPFQGRLLGVGRFGS